MVSPEVMDARNVRAVGWCRHLSRCHSSEVEPKGSDLNHIGMTQRSLWVSWRR